MDGTIMLCGFFSIGHDHTSVRVCLHRAAKPDDANGSALSETLSPTSETLRANDRACDAKRTFSGESFFRATEPWKACIQDRDTLRGGCIQGRACWDGCMW
jgi:hypothetical protein